MFGFSLPKIVVLMVIIALVWYGFKVFSRERKVGKSGGVDDIIGNKQKPPVDMKACSVCGDFVAIGSSSCGADDCPFRVT